MPCDERRFQADVRGRMYFFCSDYCRRTFLEGGRIAYFSMEIGLSDRMHTYSGGLGVLAGDTVRSSADLKIPLVAVTLVSRQGYLTQRLTADGRQLESPDPWVPSEYASLLPAQVALRVQGREVRLRAWLHDHQSPTGGMVSVLFLDTDVEGNAPEDRALTSYLYGGDARYRLQQELILGVGGVRILEAAGFTVRRFHMNEGHSSLLTLELLARHALDANQVKDLCVFTTHTPVEAGHDKFPYDLVAEVLGDTVIPLQTVKAYGGQERLNMTRLALNLSKYVNGVAQRHRDFSRRLFPGYHISAITNGVHSFTWTCEDFRTLYDRYIPGWAVEPGLLARVELIPDEAIWDAHTEAKRRLFRFVAEASGIQLDPDVLTLGFARRATPYKRSTLLFADLDRLRDVNRKGRLQAIFAGKAHPRDDGGKRLITAVHDVQAQLRGDLPVVYLADYDMRMASLLTAGVDVWLNTPLPPLEASGTSGMKAAHNGVLNFSVLDGWWLEGCIEGVTGWSIGPPPDETIPDAKRRGMEVDDLYSKLEYLILQMFYNRRDEWIHMMEDSIGKVAYHFNSHRMMRRYVTDAYL
jgi:starch phosphorylase